MLIAISSSLSSRRIDGPPEARRTTGTEMLAGMLERRMPRVQNRASTEPTSGAMSRSIRSRPVVGPWK